MLFRDKALIQLESVDSTNNYAASMVKMSRPPEGTVITALEQTQGKGQRGATWQSKPGENLLMSVILYPPFLNAEDLFALSEAVSLAVSDALEAVSGSDTFIKWPNDIVIKDQKVAGILIETAWTESRVQSVVCGIGINLNQQQFDFPNASSLFALTGREFEPDSCREEIMNRIEANYLRLRTGQQPALHHDFLRKLYRLNQPTQFIRKDGQITATITGVSRNGRLQLIDDTGEPFSCNLKEITMIYP